VTATAPETKQTVKWRMKGLGYEFCNCNPGCTCNFMGFPSSSDGSCQAFVATQIVEGNCGDVDLSGVTTLAIINWPKAIHDGGGKAVFVVPPETTEEQVGALAQICTGQYGGMPWEILGTTYEVAGLVKTPIHIEHDGLSAKVSADGVGEAVGDYLKNPVTGERHEVHIVLPEGFIWSKGECGVGSINAAAEGLSISTQNSNWIYYELDQHN
jgi:hypothetical protein